MSGSLELLAQLRKVVDLAVEHDPDRLVVIGHRLVAAREVDDREATETEPQAAGVEVAFVVRPACAMEAAIARIVLDRPVRLPKLYWPQMPHMALGGDGGPKV